jgi:hypothetical protein
MIKRMIYGSNIFTNNIAFNRETALLEQQIFNKENYLMYREAAPRPVPCRVQQ